jgi:predicted Zn-dependent protease
VRWLAAAAGLLALSIPAPPAAFTLVSVEDEIAIGRQANAQVRRDVPQVSEALVSEYVSRLGTALAAAAPGPRYPYSFAVADYRDLNAFALPGGPVWVHRGALQAAGSESQVAGILAHEIAHIAQRHAGHQLTKAMVANGLLGLLGALLGNDGGAHAARAGAGLLASGIFLKFSRDDEMEADRVGAAIASEAGWDPQGLIDFLETLRREQGRNPRAVEVFLSTHPSPDGRVDRLRQEVRRLPRGARTSGQFTQMQRRLARMPAAPAAPR